MAKENKEQVVEVYGKEAMVDAIFDEVQALEGGAPASVKALTKKAISTVLDIEQGLIMGAVANGDKVRYIGFGSFEKRHRQARKGRNPQNGEEIQIDAQDVPAFAPGKDFKQAVNTK